MKNGVSVCNDVNMKCCCIYDAYKYIHSYQYPDLTIFTKNDL